MDKENAVVTEHLFSAKFACPICNYSLAELEPRLFSFNSPVGACPPICGPTRGSIGGGPRSIGSIDGEKKNGGA